MKIMALIPAYNESDTIGDVISQLQGKVDEVVVVDDASVDNTKEIAEDNGANVVSHIVNRGQGAAVRTGYRYAIEEGYDFVVQVDADGQHDPSYIPKLVKKAKSGYDIVIGSRHLTSSIEEYNVIRSSGMRFFTWLLNKLSGMCISDVTSGFRVYRVSRLDKLIRSQDRYYAIEETFEAARKGLNITEIPVEIPSRKKGESKFDLRTFAWWPFHGIETILRIILFRRSDQE